MRRVWAPQVLSGVMLAWALNPENPYGYYVLLRWVCCAVFAYLAHRAAQHSKDGWVWCLGSTAALYNPVVPAHLTREIWLVVNIVTIGIALSSIFALKLPVKDDTA